MPKQRITMILLAVAGLVVVAIAAYFLFFAGSDHIEGAPSFVYFRLPT